MTTLPTVVATSTAFDPNWTALLTGAVLLTFLLSFIVVLRAAQGVGLRSVWSTQFLIYFVLASLGNVVSVSASVPLVAATGVVPPGPGFLWPLIIGIFGFEAILKNINVTFLEANALTISDWLKSAQELAVEQALTKDTDSREREVQKVADVLVELPIETLATQAAKTLGPDQVQQLRDEAGRFGFDESLHLALAMAVTDLDSARAVVNKK